MSCECRQNVLLQLLEHAEILEYRTNSSRVNWPKAPFRSSLENFSGPSDRSPLNTRIAISTEQLRPRGWPHVYR
jgi:hypothetical protein